MFCGIESISRLIMSKNPEPRTEDPVPARGPKAFLADLERLGFKAEPFRTDL
jgi:hypothetical protein